MTAPVSTTDFPGRGDHDAANVDGDDRRSLSVAEIQQVLRELRARRARPVAAGIGAPSWRHENAHLQQSAFEGERALPAGCWTRPRAGTPAGDRGDTTDEGPASGGDIADAIDRRPAFGGGPETGWVAVLAAHAGAGASTVALLVSDAAAAQGRQVHLIGLAHPFGSGLVAAASDELGLDVSGAWRRGRRTGVLIDRRATDGAPADWPVPPVGDDPALTVIDLDLPGAQRLSGLAVGAACCVIVLRPTLPAIRLTEQLLEELAQQPVAVASVGSGRWPSEVIASLGPRLRALRAAGRVVTVPMHRGVQVAGLTSAPLPRPLRSAGHSLLRLIDDSPPRAVPAPSAATHPVVPPKDPRR